LLFLPLHLPLSPQRLNCPKITSGHRIVKSDRSAFFPLFEHKTDTYSWQESEPELGEFRSEWVGGGMLQSHALLPPTTHIKSLELRVGRSRVLPSLPLFWVTRQPTRSHLLRTRCQTVFTGGLVLGACVRAPCDTFKMKSRLQPQPEKELVVPYLCQLRCLLGTTESQ
jgi:hypothetical protein